MCGIIARIGENGAVDELMTGLRNLEYRGYDSAGIAVANEHGIEVRKREGETDALHALLSESPIDGPIGIGHTRWSTHGRPSDANAHPHTDDDGRVAVVHNGIIRNHDRLRNELVARGHEFESETDTEVVPHLVAASLDEGLDPEDAFRAAIERLEGSYAIAMIAEGYDAVYAARSGSPLVIGLDDDATYLASDVPAFLEFTEQVVYLEDDDVVVITDDGYRVTDLDGAALDRSSEVVDWAAGDAQKGAYNHFMRKEIDEQPVALRQAIEGRIDDDDRVDLSVFPNGELAEIDDVVFVACGTSYHAAMYGSRLLRRRGIRSTVARANEFAYDPLPVDEGTLIVAVTQSGETADTLASLRAAVGTDARTLAVTNVVGSTAAREADETLFIRAGPEIGVAATKTFSSQVAALALLAERIADEQEAVPLPVADGGLDRSQLLADLRRLPDAIESVVASDDALRLAERYRDADSYFFIGRGVGYPVALEGALKFKEITYDHAEGFAAGQLKHGPLALVTSNTVVIATFTGRNDEQTIHNVQEAKSRGAPVIGIGPESSTAAREAVDEYLSVPDVVPELAGVLANAHLQLLAYHAAELRDRAIDKPRNLAKSVTVE
ncbi:glutamine--fructose-6-phosphate transaminase (isomerizing) [Halorubrum sp. JWXQ-INN 858]|uniref:glutamine--fructose-6-phosphate transaminase (isomerizing) n=1 Tax=Halorubrum sp. JWXQ-INN 858 TaxID=2690782 RepID=UPI001357D1E3|nr:glutamine--fructose-6-phosphate transaminase (isomerizing) [Halorubrum sp. JWXQ-INN 858]MWV65491.1 glutamine--fructose-6-phosphate transaminase (isomerizing) [Halorubrum sp. JWXQ-INN 858]